MRKETGNHQKKQKEKVRRNVVGNLRRRRLLNFGGGALSCITKQETER